jgi:hypothetical protein
MSLPRVSLGQACRDPALLGGVVDWWPEQLRLLDSLDGPEQLHLWPMSRQVGKTLMGAATAVHNATLRPDLDALLPVGRLRYSLCVAPGEAQSIEFVRNAAAFCEHSPLLRGLAEIQRTRIDFEIPREVGGRRWLAKTAIAALTSTARTSRGYTSSLNVFEEFGHTADTGGPGSDEAIWSALQPALRAFGAHGKTLAISTPSGRHGKFFELCEQAEGGLLKSATVQRGAVWDVVPDVDAAWLDEQRVQLGEALFQQELGAASPTPVAASSRLASTTWRAHRPHPRMRPAGPPHSTPRSTATASGWCCSVTPRRARTRSWLAPWAPLTPAAMPGALSAAGHARTPRWQLRGS